MLRSLLAITFVNLVDCQRYTRPLFEPLQLPSIQGRNYQVTEDNKGIFHESAGNQLRFGLNPRLGNPGIFLGDESFEKFADGVRKTRPPFEFPLHRQFPPKTFFGPAPQQIDRQRQEEESKLIYSPAYRHSSHSVVGGLHPSQSGIVYSQSYFPQEHLAVGQLQPIYPRQVLGGFHQPLLGFHGYNQGYHDQGKRNLGGSLYNQAAGQQSVEASAGQKKSDEGIQYLKQNEGNSGLYANHEAKKKAYEDVNKFGETKSINKEGQTENEQKNKLSHRKGHVIKSFKNSHHKDETGNDEQYYDEAHDEGGSFKFDSNKGKFGESESSSHKGVQENRELDAHEEIQQGEHKNAQFAGKNSEHEGKYDEQKHVSDASLQGKESLQDEQSLLGHQDSKRALQEQAIHDSFNKDT